MARRHLVAAGLAYQDLVERVLLHETRATHKTVARRVVKERADHSRRPTVLPHTLEVVILEARVVWEPPRLHLLKIQMWPHRAGSLQSGFLPPRHLTALRKARLTFQALVADLMTMRMLTRRLARQVNTVAIHHIPVRLPRIRKTPQSMCHR